MRLYSLFRLALILILLHFTFVSRRVEDVKCLLATTETNVQEEKVEGQRSRPHTHCRPKGKYDSSFWSSGGVNGTNELKTIDRLQELYPTIAFRFLYDRMDKAGITPANFLHET